MVALRNIQVEVQKFHMENKVGVRETSRGPYITTFTDKKFYPSDIRPIDIDITDIAHALSNQCRFGGHTIEFYSVASHCLLVSKVLPPELKLQGLLHDASEAYLVDVPRPIKYLPDFNRYREIEAAVQKVIYKKFGCNWPDPDEIHKADNLLLATEARDLMRNPSWCHLLPKLEKKIVPRGHKRVFNDFIRKFEEYKQGQ